MNTLRFKQHPLAVATKTLVFGACAAVLFGCGSDDRTEEDHSVDNTDNSVVEAPATTIDTDVDGSQLTGTVSGSVRDTNGAPVEGATVVLNGAEKQTATTDASGYYSFKDVVVTGLDRDAGNGFADQISISVMANGFASATTSVSPVAASEDTEAGTNSQIIVDNFVSTANVVIPKMESSVAGNLRLDTGEPAVGVTVKLDFQGVLAANTTGSSNTQDQVVDNSSVGFPTVSVVTNENGDFTFVNLPADSTFELHVDGYRYVTPAPTTTVTTEFDAAQHLANGGASITVEPYAPGDGEQPYLEDMPQVVSSDSGRGILAADVDGTDGITLTFSEPMQAVAAENVFVYSVTNSAYLDATVTMSADARSMTLTLGDAIAAEEEFNVLISEFELADAAGNQLAIGHADQERFVTLASNSQRNEFIEIPLQGFVELNTNGAVELTQVFSAPEAEVNAFEDIDGDDENNNILQLNSGGSTAARLRVLASAQEGEPVTVSTDTAVVNVNLVEGSNYTISHDGVTLTNTPNNEYVLTSASVGDTVEVTVIDDFGHPVGEVATLTLRDVVPATVALQESYGLGNSRPLTFVGEGSQVIDGGEVVVGQDTTANAGSPLIHVSPRMLAGTQTVWEDVQSNGVYPGLTIAQEEGLAALDAHAYASTQWTAFASTPVPATIGVAFTEQITLTGTPAWAGATALTGFTSVNGSAGTASNQDFINDGVDFNGLSVNVSNVLGLAADARSANNQIDFTGDVTDTAGNVSKSANDKAMVAFADAIPPFVTSAVLTEDAFVVTFNEPVQDNTANKDQVRGMTLAGTALSTIYTSADEVTIDGAVVTFSNDDTTKTEMTTLVNLFSNGRRETTPSLSSDDQFDFNEGTVLRGHAYLEFAGVHDIGSKTDSSVATLGVSWNEFLPTGTIGSVRPDVQMVGGIVPKFLAADEVGRFRLVSTLVEGNAHSDTTAGDDDGIVRITYSFNHALDLDSTSANALRSNFRIDLDGAGSGAAAALTAGTVTLSPDKKSLIVTTAEAANAIKAGTIVSFTGASIGSAVINDSVSTIGNVTISL